MSVVLNDIILIFQDVQEEMQKRVSMLSTMRDLVTQIEDLTEDKALPEASDNVTEISNVWEGLARRLSLKRKKLSVRLSVTYCRVYA